MPENRRNIVRIILYGMFFLFLYVIFHLTPLCGDDWVYASAMRESSLIANTLGFYQTWSGRVLGEFFSFLFASHKRLWEVMNAGILTGTVYLIARMKKNTSPAGILLLMFLFLSVPYYLRAQTYTFIVGSAAYLVPLPLLVIYLTCLKDMVRQGTISTGRTAVCAFCAFVLTLFMQNLSALTVFLSLMAAGYAFIKKICRKETVLFLALSIAGTLIIALSPGSSFRMARDFPEFASLGIFGKIGVNLRQFLNLTFFYHKPLMIMLCGMLAIQAKELQERNIRIPVLGIMMIHIVLTLSGGTGNLTADTVWAAVFTCVLLYLSSKGKQPLFMSALVLGAGASNAVMMASPVFGDRSALYTVVLLIIYLYLLFDVQIISERVRQLTAVLLAAGIAVSSVRLGLVYRMVRDVNAVRYHQTEYYRIRPDAEEAWFLAYPDYSIHSPNIEETDTVHIEAFRRYYWLGENTRIRFYYLDDYSHQRLMEELKQTDE